MRKTGYVLKAADFYQTRLTKGFRKTGGELCVLTWRFLYFHNHSGCLALADGAARTADSPLVSREQRLHV